MSTRNRIVNQVRITFTRKPISAWGGIAALVGKFLEVIEFRSWVESHVPIEERSPNGKGVYEKVLAQFLTVLSGGVRFSHLGWWGSGLAVMLAAFGVDWLPQAASVPTRFWNKVWRQSQAERLGDAGRGLVREVVTRWEGIREDNLNMDSSVLTRYGHQEGARRGYNPKKPGRPAHHPLLAFIGAGYVVNVWNRRGDTFAGDNAIDFLTQTRHALGSDFAVRRVLCDAGFYLVEFLEHLEEQLLAYIIAVPISRVLQREILGLDQWREVAPGIEVAAFFFQHRDPKWKRPRRYVVVRQSVTVRPTATGKQPSLFEELEDWKEYRFSLLLTSDQTAAPEQVWRDYRPRANDENAIKDLKSGYGFAAFNTHGFWATEAVMVMNALVFHNLIHYLNRHVLCARTAKQQLRTIRAKYFIIPAQLGYDGGYQVLRLAVRDRPLRARLLHFLAKIALLPQRLNCIALAS